MLKISIRDMSLNITNLRYQRHLSGTIELSVWEWVEAPLRYPIAILNDIICLNKFSKIFDSQRKFEGNMPNFVFSTGPADALAPFGARASAGAVMTKTRSCIYPTQALEGLTGVGVTKPISPFPLFSQFFTFVEIHFRFWISCLYLTEVAAAQLQWQLSNTNVIKGT